MFNTTLCYLEQDESFLMLHRVKKKNDCNKDKWIGVGGKFESDESPDECLLREVREETGLILTSWLLRGVVTFVSDEWETEQMFLYTADAWEGTLPEDARDVCTEGELVWVPKKEIDNLNIWEGDKVFFRLLEETKEFFTLKLRYEGDKLVDKKITVRGAVGSGGKL